jgi:N4-gp56 family major capsid protein
MAVGPSTTGSLNDLLPKIIQEAMFVASERSIMRGLVKNYTLSAGQGKTVNVPIYPRQTAGLITEGNEVDSTQVETSEATFTVQPFAIRTLLTDFARVSSASNVVADLGRLFGEAIARKMDTDLTSQFYNFSSYEGNWGSVITAADVFKAVAKLKAQAVPTEGMVCVLHPSVAYDLKASLTTAGNTPFTSGGYLDIGNEAMRMGFVGMLAGIPVYETSNIALRAGGDAGDYAGAVFQRDALGLGMIGDISIETQRRASFLGDDIVCSAYYGTGIIQTTYGSTLAFDSSLYA